MVNGSTLVQEMGFRMAGLVLELMSRQISPTLMSVCGSGLRVPIAYSLLGGGVPIPEQRLCWTLDSVPIFSLL